MKNETDYILKYALYQKGEVVYVQTHTRCAADVHAAQ